MDTATYQTRRGELETYFDRTAMKTWEQLTSDAPVSKIRQTVRAGRDEMREALLNYLGSDLRGKTVLDAGCGTGALSIEAAHRGANVTAIDISHSLVEIARERAADRQAGSIEFHVGDMVSVPGGAFDHVVAMDSFIHYDAHDIVQLVASLASRARRSIVFTFAPRTPALAVMHMVGKLFPRKDRSPAIIPISEMRLIALIEKTPRLKGWRVARTKRVKNGFYISQALELVRQ